MDVFVYADESGVFDRAHEERFAFGGIVLLGAGQLGEAYRLYRAAEASQRTALGLDETVELKATVVGAKAKGSLFRAMNRFHRFGVVISLRELHPAVFADRKTRQRYLDWAFCKAVRHEVESLIAEGALDPDEVRVVRIVMDEHSTATNGAYEIGESLERELRIGTFDEAWRVFTPPVLPRARRVVFEMGDSKTQPLIRAADITANRLYHAATAGRPELADRIRHITLP